MGSCAFHPQTRGESNGAAQAAGHLARRPCFALLTFDVSIRSEVICTQPIALLLPPRSPRTAWIAFAPSGSFVAINPVLSQS